MMAAPKSKVHVYVRAKPPEGKVVTCHVNDLTEESFRDFVCQVLVENHMMVGVMTGDKPEYFTRQGYTEEADVA